MFFGVGHPKFYVYNKDGTLIYTFEFKNYVLKRDNQTPANRIDLEYTNPFTYKKIRKFVGYRFVEDIHIGSPHFGGTISQWIQRQASEAKQTEIYKLIRLLELQDDSNNRIVYVPHADTEDLISYTEWEVNVIVTKWYYDSVSGRMDAADVRIEGKHLVNRFRLPLPVHGYVYDGLIPQNRYNPQTGSFGEYIPPWPISGDMYVYDGLIPQNRYNPQTGAFGEYIPPWPISGDMYVYDGLFRSPYYKVLSFPTAITVVIEGLELYHLWNGVTNRRITLQTVCSAGAVVGELPIPDGEEFVSIHYAGNTRVTLTALIDNYDSIVTTDVKAYVRRV